jgi:hypothetical protein
MKKLAIVLGLLSLFSGVISAHAEPVSPCRTVRAEEAAILQVCGLVHLRSFALSMEGSERTAVREHTNKFKFVCRPGFCQDEPDIVGWFIDPDVWTQSKQDEPSIFDILATETGWKMLHSDQHFRSALKPTCEPSSVTFAGLPGKMMCYNTVSDAGGNVQSIVMVAADGRVGFLILFQSRDSKDIKGHAVSSLRAFSLARGEGDRTLERWMRP